MPLMVSVARPLPVDPKMKFESRAAITAFAGGYVTRGTSGPSIGRIGGSGGAAASSGTPGAGTGRDADPAGMHDHAASAAAATPHMAVFAVFTARKLFD